MAKKDKAQPAMSAEWQQAQQARYRRIWRQQLEAIAATDDDAIALMRTAGQATELGMARPTTVKHAIAPALLGYIERGHQGVRPAAPTNPSIVRALGHWARDPYALARARVALAQERPDDSLIVEVLGWNTLLSENDLARAFDTGPRSGWAQQRINERKYAATTWLRAWLARRAEQQQEAC